MSGIYPVDDQTPSASKYSRGWLAIVRGASGVADVLKWVRKKADDSYDVVTVAEYDADIAQIAALTDPNADRMLFWDDSAGAYAYLAPGTGLSITTTTINNTGAAAVHTHAQSDITDLVGDLALKAPLASPTFTGTLTADVVSATGDVSLGNATSDLLTITGRVKSAGTSPGIAAGAALGPTPTTCSLSGTDRCGTITLDSDSGPTTGTLATITFNAAKPNTNYVVILLPRDADSLVAVGSVRAIPADGSSWTMEADVAISTNSHVWQYIVEEF